jgi:hypothetical protein
MGSEYTREGMVPVENEFPIRRLFVGIILTLIYNGEIFEGWSLELTSPPYWGGW